jgi:CDP-diacylglycerol--glycerol-3-phosphate 3-phosphatidyltransferase
MISIYNIKPKFQQFLSPVLHLLHKSGVTANQITSASLILSLLIGIAFWFAADYPVLFLALPVGLFLRMALNALDGMMARTYSRTRGHPRPDRLIGLHCADIFSFGVFSVLLKTGINETASMDFMVDLQRDNAPVAQMDYRGAI